MKAGETCQGPLQFQPGLHVSRRLTRCPVSVIVLVGGCKNLHHEGSGKGAGSFASNALHVDRAPAD